MLWANEQIDSWCLSFRAYRQDLVALGKAHQLHQHRCGVRQDILQQVLAFLDGHHTLHEFNAALHHDLHPDWNAFGLHGLSGRTFLNKLVQALSQEGPLTQHLRAGLRLPCDVSSARQTMENLYQFLEDVIIAGHMSRGDLQPARVPFFLSTWWALQDPEVWPRFAGALRQCLFQELPLASPTQDPIALYFAFRERFLTLKTAFGISSWELEQFLLWHHQHEHEKKQVMPAVLHKREAAPVPSEASRRLALQWLLAKIGRKVGCQIWIPRQQQEQVWNQELFEDLSLPALPSDSQAEETSLEEVAVLWLWKEEVIAAYEITPSVEVITTHLLRLYDFSLTRAKRKTRLCLVLPRGHFVHAQHALARPFFRPFQERHACTLLSEEHLTQHGEHILRWASNPIVIDDIVASDLEEHS